MTTPHSRLQKTQTGFALVATISVMVLLVLVALAMLSMATITVRQSSADTAQLQAQANARMALMLAIAELQKTAGSDQRITADGSILGNSTVSPHAIGVWEAWSPSLSKNITGSAPDYDTPKTDGFLRWLVSGDEVSLSSRDWVLSQPAGEQINLFGQESDGFSLDGTLMPLENSNRNGGFAWAIAQEGTKAKINVAGPELADRDRNSDLQVQPRPNVGESEFFSQPVDSWNQRSSRVIDMRQALLDTELDASDANSGGAHFTTSSMGLLTDVVNGGLKVDLSLGFEMSDSDFAMDSWPSNGETINNPFRQNSVTDFNIPASYNTQRPLYEPISETGVFSHERPWQRGVIDQVHFHYPVTAVPTFDTLRSFYSIPHHLYQSEEGVTVFERRSDHIAAAEGTLSANFSRPPHIASNGLETQVGIRPVLDRVMFYFQVALTDENTPTYVITPIITLWNPYNTALEIEGAVAYPWLDWPIRRTFGGRANGQNLNLSEWMSRDVDGGTGSQSTRQIDPYFFAAITGDGNPINSTPEPIAFEPGEIRIFVPSSSSLQEFDGVGASTRERTLFMRPVDSVADFDVSGGLIVTLDDSRTGVRTLASGDSLSLRLDFRLNSANFPLCIGLSDTTIAQGSNPADNTRGQLITDIFDTNFGQNVVLNEEVSDLTSPEYSFAQLKQEPQPAFTIEVYHRTAIPENDVQSADLLFTGNPRQSSMNPFITNTEFQTGPQYKVRMRAISSTDDLLQISSSGDRPAAFYGATQSSDTGRSHLSFFEIPRTPLLSLADFQHADLAPTPFAPANQFANSWASAYVERDQVTDGNEGLEVDHSYLINESLWDSYFFSGATPNIEPANNRDGSASVWENQIATQTESLENVLRGFAENPNENPLRNPRMTLRVDSLNGMSDQEFADAMLRPEACTKIAEHLMVDGVFNVNSTSVEAWTALLLGLQGASFDLGDGATATVTDTPFPRFRDPLGTENDNWQGFRSLTSEQITELAENIVEQVRERGPFLSLGEFVNRRIEDSELGLRGAIQAAIDATSINDAALQNPVDASNYEQEDQDNIATSDTGIGIPGYLTQADLLKSIAPVITVRSDTFTIRTYGEVRDNNDNITAQAWAEATVQRIPEFTDQNDTPDTLTANLSDINREYGRQFRIVSFRYLAAQEALALSQ